MDQEDDDTVLSEHARLALMSFLQENAQKLKNETEKATIDEDWELSQFWYDEETSKTLAKAAIGAVGEHGRIACVSCPSTFTQLEKISTKSEGHVLLEYDKRFQEKFPDHAVFYDYNNPLNLSDKFQQNFDIVLADPPYLSLECLEKFTKTIHFLTNKKIVLCTGSIMENAAKDLLQLNPCKFKPKHERKLGNEFKCFANFDFDTYVSQVE